MRRRAVSLFVVALIVALLPGCMLYSIESGAPVSGTGQNYTFRAGIDYDPVLAYPILGDTTTWNTNGTLSEAEVRVKVRTFRSTGALCYETGYSSSPAPVTPYSSYGITAGGHCATPGGSPWFAKGKVQLYNGAPYATYDTYATPKKSY